VPLTGKVSPERLGEFYLASSALPENPTINIHSAAVDRFRAPNGDLLSTDHPVTKAAMLCLSELWPQAIPFDSLFAAAYARLHGQPPAAVNALDMDRQLLGANLLKGYSYNADLVEFHVYCPPFTTQISQKPVASPLARYQVENGAKTVTNLRHEMIKVEGLGRYLLPYLDGSWSRPALAKLLDSLVNEGAVELELAANLPQDWPARQVMFDDMVGAALQTLANAALLTG
jgi:methyltransferase-like protein